MTRISDRMHAMMPSVQRSHLEFGTPVLPECPIILALPEGGGKPTSMAWRLDQSLLFSDMA